MCCKGFRASGRFSSSKVLSTNEFGVDRVNTGNRIAGTPADQIILLGNSLAGYIQTKSGRHVTFMIAVGNVPLSAPLEVEKVTEQQARMVAAIYQAL